MATNTKGSKLVKVLPINPPGPPIHSPEYRKRSWTQNREKGPRNYTRQENPMLVPFHGFPLSATPTCTKSKPSKTKPKILKNNKINIKIEAVIEHTVMWVDFT